MNENERRPYDVHRLEDADIIARAVALLLDHDNVDACAELTKLPIADPIEKPAVAAEAAAERPARLKTEPLDNAHRVRIYKRDGWRCRYCVRKLVVPGVLQLLTTLCPDFKGLLPGHHMPVARTEPAVERVYPNVDHIHAVSLGGAWRDETNHVTACTPCNTRKSDQLGWIPGPIVLDDWDGLTAAYRSLAGRLGEIGPYHVGWLRILERTTPSESLTEAPLRQAQTPVRRSTLASTKAHMPGQSYIVTDRGGSRSYATLVTVNGPNDGNLYIKAQEAAAALNRDLADCGKEVSAFPISESKRRKWLDLQRAYADAENGMPETLQEVRRLQSERQSFLEKL